MRNCVSVSQVIVNTAEVHCHDGSSGVFFVCFKSLNFDFLIYSENVLKDSSVVFVSSV